METKNPIHRKSSIVSLVTSGLLLSSVGCGEEAKVSGQSQALVAECAADPAQLPSEAWTCNEELTVECNTGTGKVDVDTLYVPSTDQVECVDADLTVSNAGPFAPGDHEIKVTDADQAVLCNTVLHVVDNAPPTLEGKTIALWPPNHKFHEISVGDCVSAVDSCDGEIQGEFIWASSDEPVDDRGDGHHSPDIKITDCGNVAVRAERQGPKDGRVYKLGVRVVDGAGNEAEATCSIIVDHDQRGVEGADSGESYRITLDGTNGAPLCDGIVEQPENPGDDDGDDGDDDDDGDEPSDTPTGDEPADPPSAPERPVLDPV